MSKFLAGAIFGVILAFTLLVVAWWASTVSESFKKRYVQSLLAFQTLPSS